MCSVTRFTMILRNVCKLRRMCVPCFTCMRGVRGQVTADTKNRVFALAEGRLREPNTIEPWSL